jgi:DNA-binding LacI/PurR family transcriptional regulator
MTNQSRLGNRGSQRTTASEVAQEAGVSLSAVSRVFTPGASVSPRMRARVMDASQKLDYTPNVLARSLMTQRTRLIGVILANFSNPIYLTILDHITRDMQQRGLRALLLNISNEDDLESMAQLVLQYSVDGLIVSAGAISPTITERCKKRNIPLVAFARQPKRGNLNVVCADNVTGGRLAARQFIDAGLQKLSFLAGPATASTSLDRGRGFTDELTEAGLSLHSQVHATFYDYNAGAEAARHLLQVADKPDAIFCANDMLAFAVLDIARDELGLKVPEDISVIGFDDVNLSAGSAYNLSTIRQPVESMVTDTLDILGRQIENWTGEWETRLHACSYIERGTVRKNRARQP